MDAKHCGTDIRWIVSLVGVVALGCGDSGSSSGGGAQGGASTGAESGGASAQGGASSGGSSQGGAPQGGGSSQGGAGSGGAAQGSGGAGGGGTGGGGTGGGPNVAPGTPGQSFVSAGGVSTSSNYRLVFSMGQPSTNTGKMSSPSYRLQGGLIGATGSLP